MFFSFLHKIGQKNYQNKTLIYLSSPSIRKGRSGEKYKKKTKKMYEKKTSLQVDHLNMNRQQGQHSC